MAEGWSRRQFLVRSGAAAAAAALMPSVAAPRAPLRPGLPGLERVPRGPFFGRPQGTTLASTIARLPGPGYVQLVDAPGWPTLTRTDLLGSAGAGVAGGGAARDGYRDRRRGGGEPRAIAALVQLTDVHLIDAQSTGRVEFFDPLGDPFTAAFRPQETLTTQVAASMVTRINRVGRGPITGRRLDCAVSTGDNVDNQQDNELAWFLTALDGGIVRPDSGTRGRYEGVQDPRVGDTRYWHPSRRATDVYKQQYGFPSYPGLLRGAIRPFRSPGLRIPWYSTYGNHDGLLQGNVPASAAFDAILTGDRKITDPGTVGATVLLGQMFNDPQAVLEELRSGALSYRTVSADPARRSVSTREWVQAHLESPPFPGPRGHGYTPDHLDAPSLYYTFPLAPGVLGISLDTGGYNSGSIGESQLAWLEARLAEAHSRYFDASGRPVRTGHPDRLVVLFSHYNRGSMTTPMVDPAHPTERRVLGPELVATLVRYPNVVAWVNGHHHVNAITPVPDPSGNGGGFWDINTASHVDYPQHARVVEIVDNRDGTLSIFTTMLEHAAPARPEPGARDALALAAINRELCANDPQSPILARLGTPLDRNAELLVKAPFPVGAPA